MTFVQLYIVEVKGARPGADAAAPTTELVREHPQDGSTADDRRVAPEVQR
ncbi:hypothetical protein [Nonomuraea indica]|uniref:Uncharacterized protein n=1 Tax=Nonomuraea indica TaxID=1581193 RepID=A0ABW8ADS1_9ACTN